VEDEEDEWPRPRGLSRRDGRRTREKPEVSRNQPNPERTARGTLNARDESIGTEAAASSSDAGAGSRIIASLIVVRVLRLCRDFVYPIRTSERGL